MSGTERAGNAFAIARARREAERVLRFAGWSRSQAVQDARKLLEARR